MFLWAVCGLILFALIGCVVLFRWNHKMMNERKDFVQKIELEKLERDLLKIKVRNR